jgi:threonine/homoserine/homoserine lactone efflux protein
VASVLLPWPQLSAFLFATLLFALSPGPAVICIVVNGATQGRRAGLAAAAGITVGNFCSAMMVALGLAVVLAMSPLVFTGLRFAAAGYLVYLGIRTWRLRNTVHRLAPVLDSRALRQIFRDAFVVAFFSPATALFFAAFLAQFLAGPLMPLPSMLALGLLYTLVMATTDGLYAFASGSMQSWLLQRHWAGDFLVRAAAFMYIGFGLYSALAVGLPWQ